MPADVTLPDDFRSVLYNHLIRRYAAIQLRQIIECHLRVLGCKVVYPLFQFSPGAVRAASLGEYENSEEALAAAEAFISTHGNEVNDEEDGIGSVIYWTVEVERRVEYKENEWLPCDESGRIDDGYGNEPNATVAYLSSLEGSREERAFELAKNEYLAWLEHKADRYTTVYGYMD